MTRQQHALQIRDAALKLLVAHGTLQEIGRSIKLRCLCANVGRFSFLHRTPFSGKLPEPSDTVKYIAAGAGKIAGNLPYGLDVNFGDRGKVLNIEWDGSGNVLVVSFRRGEWESEMLALTAFEQAA